MLFRSPAVTVDLDYQAPESLVDFDAQISLQPLFAVREAFALLGGGVPIAYRLIRGKKKTGGNHK